MTQLTILTRLKNKLTLIHIFVENEIWERGSHCFNWAIMGFLIPHFTRHTQIFAGIGKEGACSVSDSIFLRVKWGNAQKVKI